MLKTGSKKLGIGFFISKKIVLS